MIKIFEETLHLPMGYSIKVSQSKDKSRLTEWEYDCPAALNVFWKLVKEDMQDIVT